ncbi:MAG TPA: CotS family spore coat protein, partial [Bacillales bacterium]|nr:CotS family spore coat protein [Bacillales bacterium]
MIDTQVGHEEAEKALVHYPVQAKKVTQLTGRSGRVQWLVETDEGPLILKREPRRFAKMLFIAGAQQHLYENGLPIAKLMQTNSGELCVDGGDYSYVLYESHTGPQVMYYNTEHLKKAMAFKAEFHEKSKGYLLPEGGKRRRRLGKWEKLYRWKLQELEGFKMLASRQANDPFSSFFLQQVDGMLERGRQAMKEIERPDYEEQIKRCLEERMFCEQDFTLSRLVMKNGDPFMKELRSVNVDLPTRDLRILLDKVMKKLSVWDSSLCSRMLRAYDDIHSLDQEEYRTLWTDLRFPHLFCSIGQNYFLREKKAWSDAKYLTVL